jgi:hypothetical protein
MSDNIRIFITNLGIIIGEFQEELDHGRVRLKRPLVAMPGEQGSVSFGPLFGKVETLDIPLSTNMEMPTFSGIAESYKAVATKVFSEIVVPTNEEKSIILGK